jgi:hypothetical protein
MQISTVYNQVSFSFASQAIEAAVATSAKPSQAVPSRDQVEVSDQALESSKKLGRHADQKNDPTLGLISEVLNFLTGKDVVGLEATPEAKEPTGSLPQVAAGYQGATYSAESFSLSLTGTISTKDGKQLGFSLQLQYDHASFASQSGQVLAGADGMLLNYSGSAAELTSTSFSFTLSSVGDYGPVGGKGRFHLAHFRGHH